MRHTWWEIGISIALLLVVSMSISCTFNPEGLEGIEPIEEGGLANAYACNCQCELRDLSGRVFGELGQALNACVPASLNANPDVVGGRLGIPPTPDEISADCSQRVQETFEAMTRDCPTDGRIVVCSCAADQASLLFEQACDQQCPGVPLANDCSNFFREDGRVATATLPQIPADFEPVCVVPSSIGGTPGVPSVVMKWTRLW